jgi:hypothetical protein
MAGQISSECLERQEVTTFSKRHIHDVQNQTGDDYTSQYPHRLIHEKYSMERRSRMICSRSRRCGGPEASPITPEIIGSNLERL